MRLLSGDMFHSFLLALYGGESSFNLPPFTPLSFSLILLFTLLRHFKVPITHTHTVRHHSLSDTTNAVCRQIVRVHNHTGRFFLRFRFPSFPFSSFSRRRRSPSTIIIARSVFVCVCLPPSSSFCATIIWWEAAAKALLAFALFFRHQNRCCPMLFVPTHWTHTTNAARFFFLLATHTVLTCGGRAGFFCLFSVIF